MKKYILVVTMLLAMPCNLPAVQSETIVHLETRTGTLEGSLLVPEGNTGIPVALIIAGSGPTDRNGNNPAMKNNSLKLLATELSKNRIASLRYDKRAIGKSRKAGLKESDLRFENYIEDAKGWIAFLANDKRFSQIVVIGHSEGSLIGMIASQEKDVDQGTTDIQVNTEDARMLAEGNQNAEKKIIKGMNHIFKEAESDRLKNIQTYNQPKLPVKPELTKAISGFIRKSQK